MWSTTVQNLLNAASEGFGTNLMEIDFNKPDALFLEKLKNNMYNFAGFKTHNHLSKLNQLLIGDDGNMISFSEFRKNAQAYRQAALKVNDLYNETYLYTEYQTAVIQSQNAANWQRFEANKDLFPYLKFNKTPNDYDRHNKYDGFIAHIDDSRWNELTPQLDFGCECYLTQEEKKPKKQKINTSDIPKEFATNVGKTGEPFNKNHNYYNTKKGDKTSIEKSLNGLVNDFEKQK